ncbi:ABC transporter ATP-binding protein [Aquabacterium humicola]|uniref:ABC transporter ATP-binding protein n=1 Tax=Aquabacterium humicola TaxID=3237377 RepID=UPI002542B4C4|nr:polysaccharide ABC transporter ATP-binding protein [Rubrivivax pictus]
MADDSVVIELARVSKRYSLEQRPLRRLWQQLTGGDGSGAQHHALHDIDLQVRRGEAIGLIGRNGAGKSTLLQVICGVLQPSSGERRVRGRIAALLELGAGFNPDLSGRENVRLNGPLLGMTPAQIEGRMDAIIDFAGIGEFIDQPVRSYSSGMFVRLAFSMATSVEPDILVIDEALSVGDGQFARKSFDRIMTMKDRGATILFCSHSTYHVEAICSRVLWLDQGRVRKVGDAAPVIAAYNDFIGGEAHGFEAAAAPDAPVAVPMAGADDPQAAASADFRPGQGRLLSLQARSGEQVGRRLKLHTAANDLQLDIAYEVDPALPAPSVIMAIFTRAGTMVASAGSHNDGVELPRDARGVGRTSLTLPKLPLLKGDYFINVFLACERGLHYYNSALYAFELEVTQDGLEQGVVTLEHHWS